MSDKYEKDRENLREENEKAKSARGQNPRGLHPRVDALKEDKAFGLLVE